VVDFAEMISCVQWAKNTRQWANFTACQPFIVALSTDKLPRETIAPAATALDSFGIRQSKLRHGIRHAKSLDAGENALRKSNILDESFSSIGSDKTISF